MVGRAMQMSQAPQFSITFVTGNSPWLGVDLYLSKGCSMCVS